MISSKRPKQNSWDSTVPNLRTRNRTKCSTWQFFKTTKTKFKSTFKKYDYLYILRACTKWFPVSKWKPSLACYSPERSKSTNKFSRSWCPSRISKFSSAWSLTTSHTMKKSNDSRLWPSKATKYQKTRKSRVTATIYFLAHRVGFSLEGSHWLR